MHLYMCTCTQAHTQAHTHTHRVCRLLVYPSCGLWATINNPVCQPAISTVVHVLCEVVECAPVVWGVG